MTIQGYAGAVYVRDSAGAVAFLDSPMTDKGDGLTFEITDDTKRYWSTDGAVTVERFDSVNLVWNTVPSSEYTVEHVGGRIIFNTAQTESIRVDASAYDVRSVAGMYEWELEIEQETEETPALGSGWNEITPLQKTGSGSCAWYWASGKFFNLIGENEVVITLYTDETLKSRYEFYGVITSSGIEVPTDGVITESLDFSTKTKIYYREG